MLLLNNCYTTVSGPFFAMCMFIFHKTEVQRVILIRLTGLNFNWFKSYGLKCILRLNATLANSQKMATDKWPIYEHFWSFFCQLYIHLSQNWGSNGHFEVLTKSKSNWNKFYSLKSKKDKKHKKPIWAIFYKIAKKRKYLDFVS